MPANGSIPYHHLCLYQLVFIASVSLYSHFHLFSNGIKLIGGIHGVLNRFLLIFWYPVIIPLLLKLMWHNDEQSNQISPIVTSIWKRRAGNNDCS
jgi:hypothetical protein